MTYLQGGANTDRQNQFLDSTSVECHFMMTCRTTMTGHLTVQGFKV